MASRPDPQERIPSYRGHPYEISLWVTTFFLVIMITRYFPPQLVRERREWKKGGLWVIEPYIGHFIVITRQELYDCKALDLISW
jgi:hypothetical protein